MSNTRTILAWTLLLLALGAWGFVGYAFLSVTALEETYFAEMTERSDAEGRGASEARIRSLIEQTASERNAFDARIGIELLSAVERVEAVGESAGVSVRVDDVSEVNPPAEGQKAALRTMRVVASAHGSFQKLMHTLLLIESLPVPLRIAEVSWEHTPSAEVSEWHMIVRMDILTSKDITP